MFLCILVETKTMNKLYLNELSYQIIGAAIEVHKQIGPGLLESLYHECMMCELKSKNIRFESELLVPVVYKTERLNQRFRCDLFIEKAIVVELKTDERILEIHQAQLLTYMHLLKSPKGIIINFNCLNLFKQGQKTLVNEFFSALPDK